MNLRKLAIRAAVLAPLAAVAATFFLNFCHLIYDCGCMSLWNGATQFCNIETAGPPDCPFCAQPNVAYGALFGTFVVQGVVVFAPGALGLGVRALLGLAAFPLVVGATGVVLGLLTGYWT
ncbi:MAG: hypothetical protein F4Z65_02765 [Acidobacteria bacterium]|nr:hypothetical protein [Acidobacteriota bacterium]MYA47412.1 hypothetical protein [Acidobacteriota bacterium]MYI39820.1 hypothetical protein [Acidobacteriota bacterium]